MMPIALQSFLRIVQTWLDALDAALIQAKEHGARALLLDSEEWHAPDLLEPGEPIIALLPAQSLIRRIVDVPEHAGHRLEAIAKLQGLSFSPWPAGREHIALTGPVHDANSALRWGIILCEREALQRAQESCDRLGARLCAVRAQGDEVESYDLRGPRQPFRKHLRVAAIVGLGLLALGALIGTIWGEYGKVVSSRSGARAGTNTPIQVIERLARALPDSSSLSALRWSSQNVEIQVETTDTKTLTEALAKARFRILKQGPAPRAAPAGVHLVLQVQEQAP